MSDMEQERTAGRRRIDRIVDPAFLEGLEERDVADLRAMRNDCHAEEERLSYQRRLIQGQLDIARAEAARRAAGDSPGLIDALPQILADEPTDRPREARVTSMYQPPGSRRDSDDVLAGDLSRIPDLSDDDLVGLVEALLESEREVSRLRSEVLRRLDLLQSELIRRYRSGGVALDDIMTRPGPQAGSGARPR